MATKEADLPIKSMTCASCAQTVEKALKKEEGVKEAHVNLATEKPGPPGWSFFHRTSL